MFFYRPNIAKFSPIYSSPLHLHQAEQYQDKVVDKEAYFYELCISDEDIIDESQRHCKDILCCFVTLYASLGLQVLISFV